MDGPNRGALGVFMVNPFIYEDAVPPDRFFNRRKEVKFFEMALRSGKRKLLIAVVGPLKFGKTSLMLKYIEIAQRYRDIIPVYIDLRKTLEPVWKMASSVLPEERILPLYRDAKRSSEALDRLFEEMNAELESQGKHLLVFLDEFHLLPQRVWEEGFLTRLRDPRSVFQVFRALIDGRRMAYIVSGSLVEPLMSALDMWGGRFKVVYLGPFSENDAREMMKKLFSEAGMDVSEEFVETLCDAAGYHPFYMQFMGSAVYSIGKADRFALREAKKQLWEYVSPVFDGYVQKLWQEDRIYVKTLIKVARGEQLTEEEAIAAIGLVRKGFLRRAPNGLGFQFLDPLFERYMATLQLPLGTPDVTVVGHWAERLVGNYLLSRGYVPFYSHDSRGAFDIYVRVRDVDVGIQVRYSTSGEVRLSRDEVERILKAAEETGWKPIIALVSKEVEFFPEIKSGVYRAGNGEKDIEAVVFS